MGLRGRSPVHTTHFTMYVKIKNIINTDYIRVPVLNGIATVIRMLTGLVSVKVVASVIGPSGIALVGQLNNFSQILQSISNGGILTGMTKYVSEKRESAAEVRAYLSTGLWITLFLTLASCVVILLFPGYFSHKILNSENYKIVIILFGVTLLFFSLNNYLIAIINGFQEYRNYILVNISGSIIGLLFSIVLALKFGVTGALIAAATFQSLVFFCTLAIINKSHWFTRENFTSRFDQSLLKNLGQYSLMAIISALTVPTAQLMVRSFILKMESNHDAGLWEGVNRITGMYLMVLTTSLSVYFLPKMAQLTDPAEIRHIIRRIYTVMVPFLVLSSFLIYLMRYWIIELLFTPEFRNMQGLFGVQLAAESIKVCGWVLGYLLLARKMTRQYIFLELVNFILLISINYTLIGKYGSWGAPMAHLIVYTIYLLSTLYIFKNILFTQSTNTSSPG